MSQASGVWEAGGGGHSSRGMGPFLSDLMGESKDCWHEESPAEGPFLPPVGAAVSLPCGTRPVSYLGGGKFYTGPGEIFPEAQGYLLTGFSITGKQQASVLSGTRNSVWDLPS